MSLDLDIETVRQAIVDDWVNAGDHSPIIPAGLAALDRIQAALREADLAASKFAEREWHDKETQ